MNIKELELFNKLDEIKEWVNYDWEYKEANGKIFCIDYIEPFIEIEHFILDRNNLNFLQEYCYKNMSLEDVQAIKRMYEETKYFIGFNSLAFNYFIDDVVDEVRLAENS